MYEYIESYVRVKIDCVDFSRVTRNVYGMLVFHGWILVTDLHVLAW